MGSLVIYRALQLAVLCACAQALTTLSAVGPGDDGDCALYLNGPGRTSAYDYSLNLLKGNFNYEGQHTCITYDAINQAYLEARNRIVVSQPKGDWKAEDFASVGELILDISINLARRYGLTYEEIEKGLPLIDTSRTLIRDVCPPVFSHVECRAGKYRRLDGLCNNLQHPTWGSTMAPFQRLIGPLFADGINAPRIAHTGRDLPLSRVVSRTMHPDHGYHDHAGTVMVIAWGQFMDHDYTLTGTPLDPLNRNDPEECCKRPPHLKHPYCNEIRIPDDDYFYRLWSVKCIDFVRAFPSPRPGCRLGSRVPFNTLTGVIDGNTIYGVTDKFSRKLRTGFGGLLRMNPVFKEYGLKDLLPLKLDIPDEGCTRPNKNMYCFEAGEIRVNEQLVLTVMHTLMAREHNRIARSLAEVNPHWDDETLFQEARRINVAEIQHITYNEFLPILLGKDVMEKFGLVLEKEGHWDGYDPQVNPDVIDAFASAAFRFGHSLLPTAVERWSKAHKFIASKRLSDLIRRPYDLYRAGVLDEYVMGLMNQVAQAMDDSITQEVTNHLFKKVGARFGMDLVSFNMQRGREFGIPGYMEFRKFCGLAGADSFEDLFGSMPNETVVKYQSIFEHPIDVDLWSGGVSERPLPGSMLGPTFACVIATQFSYSRRGDRFWFELPNQPSSFTPEQLAEIRKARLARVICDNTDIIDTVQLYPMVLPDHELNPRVPCRSGIIPGIDFSKWAEPAPFHAAKPFVTEAYVKVNETIDERNITSTDNIDLNSSYVNNTKLKNIDKNISGTEAIHKAKKNEQHKTDTVLKYVYKKDDKVNIPEKPNSHPLNSLKRKKRSSNSSNAPLIVNYETNHDGPQRYGNPSSERLTGKVVKTAEIADFNIETLHDHHQHQGQENTIHLKPQKDKSDETESEGRIIVEDDDKLQLNNDSTIKGERSDRESNEDSKESQENKNDRKNNSSEQSQERDSDDSRENSESKESYRADGESPRRREDYKSNESLHIDSREKPYTDGENGEKIEYQNGSGTAEESKKFPTSHETILFNVDARYHNRGNQNSNADNTDSNEGRERSGESTNSNSAENRSNENSKFTNSKLRPDSSDSGSKEKDSSRENVLDKIIHQPSDADSSEEEAIIAIMKKKKKQHDKPEGTYTAADEIYDKKSSPITIKDVDLSDFTYERIHVNEKGVVAPVKDIHDQDRNAPLIQPVTTIQPQTEYRNKKHNANFVSSTGIPYSSESSEENKEAVKIDGPEVKPVVEINSENKESIENNSKEALKTKPNDDDLSLETLLGVKLSDSEEKGDKITEKDGGGNGDVKQQFERIPLNYNHAKTEQQNNETSDEHKDTLQKDHNKYNPEPVNIITPELPVKYDEHLNFKFDDVSIKIPEIQLPDDILAFPHDDEKEDEDEDESYHAKKDKKRKKAPKKSNFFHYDEHEYNADEPHSHKLVNHEDHEPSYYNYNYGKEEKKEKYKKKEKQEENSNENDDNDHYRNYYGHYNDDDEDLYEKFVRERFGKKDTFEQRSAKLSAPTRPAEDNAKLFHALQNVLVRAQNIEKEAVQSGDPNAGYMWTVEYGRDL